MGYSLERDGLTKEGKLILKMAGNVIINGIKNALNNQKLPSTKSLVCKQESNFSGLVDSFTNGRLFETVTQNGKKAYRDIIQNAIGTLKNSRN